MDEDIKKGAWSAEEDELLKRTAAQIGTKSWVAIARHVPGRSAKSCRLRWCNQLCPGVIKIPFSEWEQAVIVKAQDMYPSKWAAVARLLPGRTDNGIKNHWNATLKRRLTSPYDRLDNGYLNSGCTLEWLLANREAPVPRPPGGAKATMRVYAKADKGRKDKKQARGIKKRAAQRTSGQNVVPAKTANQAATARARASQARQRRWQQQQQQDSDTRGAGSPPTGIHPTSTEGTAVGSGCAIKEDVAAMPVDARVANVPSSCDQQQQACITQWCMHRKAAPLLACEAAAAPTLGAAATTTVAAAAAAAAGAVTHCASSPVSGAGPLEGSSSPFGSSSDAATTCHPPLAPMPQEWPLGGAHMQAAAASFGDSISSFVHQEHEQRQQHLQHQHLQQQHLQRLLQLQAQAGEASTGSDFSTGWPQQLRLGHAPPGALTPHELSRLRHYAALQEEQHGLLLQYRKALLQQQAAELQQLQERQQRETIELQAMLGHRQEWETVAMACSAQAQARDHAQVQAQAAPLASPALAGGLLPAAAAPTAAPAAAEACCGLGPAASTAAAVHLCESLAGMGSRPGIGQMSAERILPTWDLGMLQATHCSTSTIGAGAVPDSTYSSSDVWAQQADMAQRSVVSPHGSMPVPTDAEHEHSQLLMLQHSLQQQQQQQYQHHHHLLQDQHQQLSVSGPVTAMHQQQALIQQHITGVNIGEASCGCAAALPQQPRAPADLPCRPGPSNFEAPLPAMQPMAPPKAADVGTWEAAAGTCGGAVSAVQAPPAVAPLAAVTGKGSCGQQEGNGEAAIGYLAECGPDDDMLPPLEDLFRYETLDPMFSSCEAPVHQMLLKPARYAPSPPIKRLPLP